jgi:cell division protein FtsX
LVRAALRSDLPYNTLCGLAWTVTVMKLSLLLICLGGLLAATALSWTQVWERSSIKQLHQLLKSGSLSVSLYAKIVGPLSLTLVMVGMYLALTWR